MFHNECLETVCHFDKNRCVVCGRIDINCCECKLENEFCKFTSCNCECHIKNKEGLQ